MNSDGHIGLGGLEPESGYILKANSSNINTLRCSKIGINRTASDGYYFDLAYYGRIYNSYNNHIIFNHMGGYYSSAIHPVNNNTAALGTSSKAFQNVYAYNYPTVSDGRQKENIRDIKKPLELVLAMKGVEYDLKKEYACPEKAESDPKMIARMCIQLTICRLSQFW